MAVVLLDYFKVVLTDKLSATGTKLPVSSSDASRICTLLGANETDLVIDGPMGSEIVRATCCNGAVCIVRPTGAKAYPAGSCTSPTLTNGTLDGLVKARVMAMMCDPEVSEAVYDCNGVLTGRMLRCGASTNAAPTSVPLSDCDGTVLGYASTTPL